MNNEIAYDKEFLEKHFKEILLKTDFFLIRHETEFSPAAGITAVTKQERRNFIGGMLIAPYFPKLVKKTEEVLKKKGKKVAENCGVTSTGISITAGNYYGEIWITTDQIAQTGGVLIPIVYLSVPHDDRFFSSYTDPYYTGIPNGEDLLKTDSLVFGLAVEGFFSKLSKMCIPLKGKFVNGADWESVPALYLIRDKIKTSVTLHNTYDECLKNNIVDGMDKFKGTPFDDDKKRALEIGMESVNAITCVNRVFAWGLLNEPFHKKVMARHLPNLDKVIGIDNGRFVDLNDKEKEILKALRADQKSGKKELDTYKKSTKEELIRKVREADEKKGKPKRNIVFERKAVFMFAGRLVPQKLHDVCAEAVRQFLKNEENKKMAVFFFPVMPGCGDKHRQSLLEDLEKDFPDNVVYDYSEECSYFAELKVRVDFNVLSSLYEPHGSVYDGAAIPVVNLIDGPLGQVYDPEATGEAARRSRLFHATHEKQTGLGFYPDIPTSLFRSQRALYEELTKETGLTHNTNNGIFRAMVDALQKTLKRAVELYDDDNKFAKITLAALEKREGGDWSVNLEWLKRVHEEKIN